MDRVVSGIPEAVAAIEGIARDAHDMTAANVDLVRIGTRAAVARAPRQTGQLGASIDGQAGPDSAELGASVRYWPFQEFGTRYVRARRFMEAGAEAMTAAAPERYQAELGRIIEART